MITHDCDHIPKSHYSARFPSNLIIKFSDVINQTKKMINYLWLKTFSHANYSRTNVKFFGDSEVLVLKNFNDTRLIEELLGSPDLFNRRILQDLRIYQLERDLFKGNDSDYEKGLERLRLLSFGMSKIKSSNKALKKKISHILSLSDLEELSDTQKLTKRELYVLNLAKKSYDVFQELKDFQRIPELDQYFTQKVKFFDETKQMINRVCREISIDNRSILFFINKEYKKAAQKPNSVFEKLKDFLRRGESTHVALLKTNEDLTIKQIHITNSHYEQNPLRYIDLLSSKFIRLDLTKFIASKGIEYLNTMFGSQVEENLNQLWNESFLKILDEQNSFNHIQNSNLRKLMCLFKFLGLPFENQDLNNSASSKMICSEFAISLIIKIMDVMEKSLINKYFEITSEKLEVSEILTNPFIRLRTYNMTPGDVYKTLSPYKSSVFCGSFFLQKIVRDD